MVSRAQPAVISAEGACQRSEAVEVVAASCFERMMGTSSSMASRQRAAAQEMLAVVAVAVAGP